MPLIKEERICIILLAGSGITRDVARTFNAMHREQVTHDTVAKLDMKFKRTCSVTDASKQVWKVKQAIDEGTSTQVLVAIPRGPKNGIRRLSSYGNQSKQCHAHFAR
ncbi:hypothetical protein AVEN_183492-1 [Araneus ventricosus]|uniref:Mos1 transposase HTH domain-containing protein n=1 Tax=Araneus ventricosus TaxID=182803 RepID=A0A4Y2IUH4_ARAVE|nr:hypothetical protein AVEN_174182-1 [Araneus ventricosus]GBM81493.1 hypothetical protein AVEN_183492-1 [Araneus ventricosus]